MIRLLSHWQLTGDGVCAPSSSFLPGAERLARYDALLGEPAEAGQDFASPRLIPEGVRNAVLCTTLSAAHPLVRLVFPELAGSGRVTLGGEEIARFSGGMLALELPQAALRENPATLAVRFDKARPAGFPATPHLEMDDWVTLEDIHLTSAAGEICGWTTIRALRSGVYRLVAQGWSVEAALEAGSSRAIPFRLPAVELLVLRVLRKDERGEAEVFRRALTCHEKPRGMPAFLPLSPEEACTPNLFQRLASLGLRAVGFDFPAAPALRARLRAAGIDVVLHRDVWDADGERLGALCWEADFPQDGDAAWQLCGLTACPRGDGGLDASARRHAALGVTPGDDAALGELLLRLRIVGTRLGGYAGPLCPAGSLFSPALDALGTKGPAIHALPLFGAWWASSAFSCRLGADAPPGSRCEAALKAGDEILAHCTFSPGERPTLQARLPQASLVAQLHIRLTLPRGEVLCDALPVPIGIRAPLEAWPVPGAEDRMQ